MTNSNKDGAKMLFTTMRQQLAQLEEQQRQYGFEESCVRKILNYAKQPLNLAAARQEHFHMFKVDRLSFRWLRDKYANFPLMLSARKLRHTSGTKIGWTDLFGSGFAKLPWVVEYFLFLEQCGCNPEKTRAGLIFNAPHADGGAATAVIHNHPVQLSTHDQELREDGGTRILRVYRRPAVTLVIESFPSFLETLGTEWAVAL